MNFLLWSGSFHSKSRSLAIIENIKPYFGEHSVVVQRLETLPFYSEDLNQAKPDSIKEFLAVVAAADGIVCCTPEYNHSVPAVLKNAIDWASRPAFASALKGMPVSIITQAASPVGGARAQAHLKLVFDSTLSEMHLCHEMMITGVDAIFDDKGVITDQKVQARLQRHIADFLQFVSRKNAAP